MDKEHEIKVGDALKQAWRLFLKAPEVFVVLTFIMLAVNFFRTALGPAGHLIAMVVQCVMPGAFYLVAEEASRKERASFQALEGLPQVAPQLLMMGIARMVLILSGFLLLVIPGIYAALALMFADFYVVLRKRNFWEAMKDSHALAKGNFLAFFGLAMLIFLVTLSGFLFVGIGVLVTAPIAFLTLYCVFQQIGAAATPSSPAEPLAP